MKSADESRSGDIPGNATDLWLARRRSAIPRGIANATPLSAARALNAEVWDVEGRRYVDFAGGIGTLATGHCHPQVVAAVERQLHAFTHTAFQVMSYTPYVELCERLNELAPFDEPAQTALFTTGAEAVENAVKVARIATGRAGVLAFSGAFHGRTFLTMGLTGKYAPYKRGYGAITADVYRIPFPVSHRSISIDDTLRTLEALFYTDLDPKRLAAIVIEPVQGEGGFNVAPVELLRRLRELCDEHGALLIADEVQSGMGRTGRMFAIEHSRVEPDLVTVAKSLAGGFPLSAVIGRERIMNQVEPGGLGSTYGGSPIGCAAALAVLDVIRKEGLIERANRVGARLRERFDSWTRREDMATVRNVRGLGAMLGFDLADGATARVVTTRALEHGLVLLTCGREAETIRVLVPLTVEDSVLSEGLDILERALRELAPT
jgi:4-aminobutyrate aminotransferase / (S)-3-amino-2-methylpropionate transaminase / 5-aminovalerate transaminase